MYDTLRAVPPYLISAKCASAWGRFVQDQVKLGEVITKENIIKTITRLEQFSELRIAVSKTLPSSVIDTTLNLPPGDEVVTIPARQMEAQVAYPVNPTHGSSSFDSTTIPAFLVQPPSTGLTN